MEVNEEDVVELVEEHSKDLTTEDPEELKKQLNQERDKEDKECSSEEEDSNKKGRMPAGDIKKCCTTGKSFSLWLQSGIPTKLK